MFQSSSHVVAFDVRYGRAGDWGLLRRLFAITFLILILQFVMANMAFAFSRGPDVIADLAEDKIDAVVNISTTTVVKEQNQFGVPMPQFPPGSPFQDFFNEFFGQQMPGFGLQQPQERKVSSLGSGFVISAEGTVITNNHVIENADEITVIFNDGSELAATIVGRDPKTDIAVLKVTPEKPLKFVQFGDSEKLRVGEWVVAIGNPFGLGGTVTTGIVSAENRDINAGPYDDFIQTDAAINRGNSGGPLFNLDGEVVGINTAILSPSGGSVGIGFSIPAATAKRVIAQLQDFGETRRGWIGVRIQNVDKDLASSLGLPNEQGALVAEVAPDGPSDKAGLKAGDVIVRFNGEDIKTARDLPRLVADTPIDSNVKLVVVRNGKERNFNIKLGRLEEGEIKKSDVDSSDKDTVKSNYGLTLERLTDDNRRLYRIKSDVKGVLVTAVEAGSEASERGLRAGVVIAQVGQENVSSPDAVFDQLEKLEKEGNKTALVLLLSPEGEPRFTALPLGGKN